MLMGSNLKFLGDVDDKISTTIKTSLDGIRSVQDNHDIEVATDWEDVLSLTLYNQIQ